MNAEDLIEKYVACHAECRWMNACDLDDLLHEFVAELEQSTPKTYGDIVMLGGIYLTIRTVIPDTDKILEELGVKNGDKVELLIRKVESTKQV